MRFLTTSCILLALTFSQFAFGGCRAFIPKFSKLYGVEQKYLAAVIEHESRSNPWALNVNKVSLNFKTKKQAIQGLKTLAKKPWYLRYKTSKGFKKRFFDSHQSALNWLYQNFGEIQYEIIKSRYDGVVINGHKGSFSIRYLDIMSTDIGCGQINYAVHRKESSRLGFTAKLQDFFDPEFNVEYTAAYLRALYKRTGSWELAIANYYNSDPSLNKPYLEAVMAKVSNQ